MLSFYRSTLDVVLRYQAITLAVFFATMALTGIMVYYTPKGFFPIQDIDLLNGIAEASQDASPQKMVSLETELDRIILGDPAVESLVTSYGPSFGSTGNLERLASSSSRATSAISMPRKSSTGCVHNLLKSSV
jgi:HAE1 family hydrophobic/amphiphilic exporter-1